MLNNLKLHSEYETVCGRCLLIPCPANGRRVRENLSFDQQCTNIKNCSRGEIPFSGVHFFVFARR